MKISVFPFLLRGTAFLQVKNENGLWQRLSLSWGARISTSQPQAKKRESHRQHFSVCFAGLENCFAFSFNMLPCHKGTGSCPDSQGLPSASMVLMLTAWWQPAEKTMWAEEAPVLGGAVPGGAEASRQHQGLQPCGAENKVLSAGLCETQIPVGLPGILCFPQAMPRSCPML